MGEGGTRGGESVLEGKRVVRRVRSSGGRRVGVRSWVLMRWERDLLRW